MTWKQLYNHAKKYINEKDFSPFIHGGQVASAIETDKGNVYYGINFDTKCDLGSCAERNAMRAMLLAGETKIVKIVTIGRDELRMPCGACREALMQLHKDSGEIEFLIDLKTEKTVKLKELIPDWWGTDRF